MKKLWIILLTVGLIEAENFDAFLQQALSQSPYLQANRISIDQAEQEAHLLQRYKNPTLSLEASKFKPNDSQDKSGYRTALTQPLRLWGVGEAREQLALTTKKSTQALVQLQRARFIQRISLLYIDYMQAVALEELAREEVAVVKKIEHITQERFKAGSSAKVKYLLAKLDTKRAENIYAQRSLQKVSTYYALLAFSGITEEPDLSCAYRFQLLGDDDFSPSAELLYEKAEQKRALADAKLQEHSVEWVDLYLEYEKEADQKIARLGVDIPLAVFNTKSEEKAIAKMQVKQKQLLIKAQKQKLAFNLKRMKKELAQLQELQSRTKDLYRAQKEMLGMYEEGYKIAKIKLIELQNLKSQMIETKEKVIDIQRQIDTNIVNYNYNAGAYNEN